MENRRIRLKKALEEKGVSQEKVAEKLGVKSQAVSARLNDTKRDIDSIDFIEAVAELTGRSSEWFIHGIERDEGYIHTNTQTLIKAMENRFEDK